MATEQRCEHVILSELGKVNEQISDAQTTIANRQQTIEELEHIISNDVRSNSVIIDSGSEVEMGNVSKDTFDKIKKMLIDECEQVVSLTRGCIYNLTVDANRLTNEWRETYKK